MVSPMWSSRWRAEYGIQGCKRVSVQNKLVSFDLSSSQHKHHPQLEAAYPICSLPPLEQRNLRQLRCRSNVRRLQC